MSYCNPMMLKSFFTVFGPFFATSPTSCSFILHMIEKNKSCGIIRFGTKFTVSSYAAFLCKMLVIIAFSVRSFSLAFCFRISRRSLCNLKVSLLVETFLKTSTSHTTPWKYDLRQPASICVKQYLFFTKS